MFPTEWKIARVTPIPKKRNVFTEMNNIRPISQTSIPGKLIEKIVNKRITNYLEINNLYFNHQFGFRKYKSTTRFIHTLVDQTLNARNDVMCSMTIFVYLFKTFDCVNPAVLLQKIKNIGIRGKYYDWIQSYF